MLEPFGLQCTPHPDYPLAWSLVSLICRRHPAVPIILPDNPLDSVGHECCFSFVRCSSKLFAISKLFICWPQHKILLCLQLETGLQSAHVWRHSTCLIRCSPIQHSYNPLQSNLSWFNSGSFIIKCQSMKVAYLRRPMDHIESFTSLTSRDLQQNQTWKGWTSSSTHWEIDSFFHFLLLWPEGAKIN